MEKTLDPKYFDHINRSEKFDTFVPKIPIGVLIGDNGTPLAGIQLCNSWSKKGLITCRPNTGTDKFQFLQGLLESEGEFMVVITNFSPTYKIKINFNKIRMYPVTPERINQINCLEPYQSYEVKSDATTKRQFFMECVKKPYSDKSNDYVTSYIDKASSTCSMGTMWEILVHPSEDMSLKDQQIFSTAKWITRDLISIDISKMFADSSSLIKDAEHLITSAKTRALLIMNKAMLRTMSECCDNYRNGIIAKGLVKSRENIRRKPRGKVYFPTCDYDGDYDDDDDDSVPKTRGGHVVVDTFSQRYKSSPCMFELLIAKDFEEIVREMMRNTAFKKLNTTVCEISRIEKPDVIFYPCGHCCVHGMETAKMYVKCPICDVVVLCRASVRFRLEQDN
jgi:hypothetical protein